MAQKKKINRGTSVIRKMILLLITADARVCVCVTAVRKGGGTDVHPQTVENESHRSEKCCNRLTLAASVRGLMARFMPLFTLPDGVCAVSTDNDFQQEATRKIVLSVYSWRREAKVEVRQNCHLRHYFKKKKLTCENHLFMDGAFISSVTVIDKCQSWCCK